MSEKQHGYMPQPDIPDVRESGAIETLTQETRVFRPVARSVSEANVGMRALSAARTAGAEDPLAYWENAAEKLQWFAPWEQVLDESDAPFYRWFAGARTNIVHNALDRHIRGPAKNRLALIWEAETGETRKYTYFELYREVNRIASGLRSIGVAKGDTVLIAAPILPETVMCMLACAKIGAVHAVVFAGFSAKVLRDRAMDVQAACVITADGYYRNGQLQSLKARVDEALATSDTDSVRMVVTIRRAGVDAPMEPGRDVWLHDLTRNQPHYADTEVMDANDPLFILHTSGTTDKPKGVVHVHGGYQVGLAHTMHTVFDIKPTDIFWCTADVGWVTGHSYAVYGPLLAGTTTVLYEGHPLYPQADRVWHLIAKYGVTIFYTTPTLIRMLKRYGLAFPKQHDITSLRLLASVGEAIDTHTWEWLFRHIGRSECPLLDTWWQSETGQVMISPLPVSPLKPSSVCKPLPGIDADVVDKHGKTVPPGTGGFLVMRKPWPAMAATLHNDPERYRTSYFERIPGCYFAGDVASRDEDGYIFIQGRADDVLNIAGHRLGTAEIEAAFTSHKAVNEAAVIGVPDPIRGEVAKAFVVLKATLEPDDYLTRELRDHLLRELGPVAVIKEIAYTDTLPKNRSGKILRRTLRTQELQRLGITDPAAHLLDDVLDKE